MLLIAILLAGGQPAPAASEPQQPAAPATETRFRSLFIDWRATADEALEHEQARARSVVAEEGTPVRQARALGDQVGEMVALGDCDGGERLARDAGDLALVSAVQDHCRRQARGGVLAGSATPVPEQR